MNCVPSKGSTGWARTEICFMWSQQHIMEHSASDPAIWQELEGDTDQHASKHNAGTISAADTCLDRALRMKLRMM